jgi:5'-nucleotidase
MRIFIDLDDTLFDYTGALNSKIDTIQYPQAEYGFFTNLKPLEGAVESINKLIRQEHDVWFLTAPSVYNPFSYTEKRVSIEKYFGLHGASKLIICSDKTLLKGDVLVDDKSWNFDGINILFGSSDFPTWKEVLKSLAK